MKKGSGRTKNNGRGGERRDQGIPGKKPKRWLKTGNKEMRGKTSAPRLVQRGILAMLGGGRVGTEWLGNAEARILLGKAYGTIRENKPRWGSLKKNDKDRGLAGKKRGGESFGTKASIPFVIQYPRRNSL